MNLQGPEKQLKSDNLKKINMARKLSMLAPDWWDFTTLDDEIAE